MAQTVAATAVLGPGLTGLAIGLRVLNLDGTEYAAFSATGVAETNVLGTYRKASGVSVPDAGAYIVWGTAATDYAEATVDAVAPTAADNATAAAAAILATPANKLATDASGYISGISSATDKNTLDSVLAALNNISVADIIAGINEGSLDMQEILRIILAATAGKSAGGGTPTITFRDVADTKARITATVDAAGNRTAISVDGS